MSSHPVTFVVLAHSEPAVFARLVADLAPHPVVAHLDRMTPPAPFLDVASGAGHVRFNPERRCVHWGGFSLVRAMFETLEVALAGERSEHYVFLSGADLVVRPVEEFVEHLGATAPVHCRAFALREGVGIGQSLDRVHRRHFFDGAVGHAMKLAPTPVATVRRRLVYPVARPLPAPVPELTWACGSQWTALPRQLVIELVDTYRQGRFEPLRDAYAADEIAVPTYIYRRPEWAEQTQHGRLEDPPTGVDLSWMPNFHYLREGLDAPLDAADLAHAVDGGWYFARKVTGPVAAAFPAPVRGAPAP